jgi:two-component system response regulator FixJ
MPTESTVFIVDDDESVRDAVRCMLEAASFRVATFASGREFLDRFDRTQPGCLILDVQMPEMDGLEVQRRLREEGVRLPIIMLTAHGNIPLAVNALRSGAIDFIEKPFDDEDLIRRIQDAISRHIQLDCDPAEKARIQERLATLSEREHEVLEMLVAGKWVKIIAAELGTSPNTVKNQRARILEKMAADSVPNLVRMVMISQMSGD